MKRELRHVLAGMGYCELCQKREGRSYRTGATAKFFGGQHQRLVLCEECWLKIVRMVQPLHRYYRNHTHITRRVKDG